MVEGRGSMVAGALAVAAAAILVHLNSLPNEYVLDDFPAVVDNPAAHWPVDTGLVFRTNYWGNRPNYEKLTIYRPLATLTFALVDGLGTDGPELQRAVNVLLHAGCSVMVFLIVLGLLGSGEQGRGRRRRGTGGSSDGYGDGNGDGDGGGKGLHSISLFLDQPPGPPCQSRRRLDAEPATIDHRPSTMMDDRRSTRSCIVAALLCGLAFAVHPVHTEAVIGVVSRAELLSALFVLLGTWYWLESGPIPREGQTTRMRCRKAAGIAVLFALALLSKENGVTLWGVILAFQAVRIASGHARLSPSRAMVDGRWTTCPSKPEGRSRMVAGAMAREDGSGRGSCSQAERPHAGWRASVADWCRRLEWEVHLAFGIVLAAYFVLRGAVLPALLGGDIPYSDNPMVGGDLVVRWLTPFKVFFAYLGLLISPANLTIDYSLEHFKVARSLADAQGLAGLALFAGLVAAALLGARRRLVLSALLLSFFATYSIVSNLPFLSTIIMAERLIYLPSAFFLAAAARLAADSVGSGRWPPRLLAAAAAAVVVVFAAGTVMRNREWRTPFDLYRAAVREAPDSAKSQHMLGNELARAGFVADALSHLRRSVEVNPDNFVARTNLARALASLGRYDEALEHLKVVLTAAPTYRSAVDVVCGIYERTGKPPAAGKVCR